VTKETVSIRKYHPTDIESLADLTTQLRYPTTIEQMTQRMERISHLDNSWTFVATLDSKVVGYIEFTKNHFWEQDGHYLKIQVLVVHHQYRRHGVGQKLIDAVEKLARRINTTVIHLNCGNRDERKAAHQFYPSVGFEAKSTGYRKVL